MADTLNRQTTSENEEPLDSAEVREYHKDFVTHNTIEEQVEQGLIVPYTFMFFIQVGEGSRKEVIGTGETYAEALDSAKNDAITKHDITLFETQKPTTAVLIDDSNRENPYVAEGSNPGIALSEIYKSETPPKEVFFIHLRLKGGSQDVPGLGPTYEIAFSDLKRELEKKGIDSSETLAESQFTVSHLESKGLKLNFVHDAKDVTVSDALDSLTQRYIKEVASAEAGTPNTSFSAYPELTGDGVMAKIVDTPEADAVSANEDTQLKNPNQIFWNTLLDELTEEEDLRLTQEERALAEVAFINENDDNILLNSGELRAILEHKGQDAFTLYNYINSLAKKLYTHLNGYLDTQEDPAEAKKHGYGLMCKIAERISREYEVLDHENSTAKKMDVIVRGPLWSNPFDTNTQDKRMNEGGTINTVHSWSITEGATTHISAIVDTKPESDFPHLVKDSDTEEPELGVTEPEAKPITETKPRSFLGWLLNPFAAIPALAGSKKAESETPVTKLLSRGENTADGDPDNIPMELVGDDGEPLDETPDSGADSVLERTTWSTILATSEDDIPLAEPGADGLGIGSIEMDPDYNPLIADHGNHPGTDLSETDLATLHGAASRASNGEEGEVLGEGDDLSFEDLLQDARDSQSGEPEVTDEAVKDTPQADELPSLFDDDADIDGQGGNPWGPLSDVTPCDTSPEFGSDLPGNGLLPEGEEGLEADDLIDLDDEFLKWAGDDGDTPPSEPLEPSDDGVEETPVNPFPNRFDTPSLPLGDQDDYISRAREAALDALKADNADKGKASKAWAATKFTGKALATVALGFGLALALGSVNTPLLLSAIIIPVTIRVVSAGLAKLVDRNTDFWEKFAGGRDTKSITKSWALTAAFGSVGIGLSFVDFSSLNLGEAVSNIKEGATEWFSNNNVVPTETSLTPDTPTETVTDANGNNGTDLPSNGSNGETPAGDTGSAHTDGQTDSNTTNGAPTNSGETVSSSQDSTGLAGEERAQLERIAENPFVGEAINTGNAEIPSSFDSGNAPKIEPVVTTDTSTSTPTTTPTPTPTPEAVVAPESTTPTGAEPKIAPEPAAPPPAPQPAIPTITADNIETSLSKSLEEFGGTFGVNVEQAGAGLIQGTAESGYLFDGKGFNTLESLAHYAADGDKLDLLYQAMKNNDVLIHAASETGQSLGGLSDLDKVEKLSTQVLNILAQDDIRLSASNVASLAPAP